ARRDVGNALAEVQVLEPRRFADVEMIDGMQVVIEARQRGLLRREPAAILQAAVDQQDVEPASGQIRAEHQAMVAGADDDAVVSPFQALGHRVPDPTAASYPPPINRRQGGPELRRSQSVPFNIQFSSKKFGAACAAAEETMAPIDIAATRLSPEEHQVQLRRAVIAST